MIRFLKSGSLIVGWISQLRNVYVVQQAENVVFDIAHKDIFTFMIKVDVFILSFDFYVDYLVFFHRW